MKKYLKERSLNHPTEYSSKNENRALRLLPAFLFAALIIFPPIPSRALTQVNSSADFAVGQPDLGSCTYNRGNKLRGQSSPSSIISADGKLIVADTSNNRVLIYNSIPDSSNELPDVIIGQTNLCSTSTNLGIATPAANSLSGPYGVYSDGEKLFIADTGNNRVLIFNSIPTSSGDSADVVVGQQNFVSKNANQGGAANANTLSGPRSIYSNGEKLFISDYTNNRVLIFSAVPSANNASANFVIGQAGMTIVTANTGGRNANRLSSPVGVFSSGTNLLIADSGNNRVLIFNSIPGADDASANFVVGQTNMTNGSANQGGAATDKTLNSPSAAYVSSGKLIISDTSNNRTLVYSSVPVSDNTSADFVIGQADFTHNSANQGGSVESTTLSSPRSAFVGGGKLFLADSSNNRVVGLDSIPADDNTSYDLVLGQVDMTHNAANQPGTPAANALAAPDYVFSDGTHLFVAEQDNNRVLIFNSIPTSSDASADVVVGQPNMSSVSPNQGGSPAANTLKAPYGVWSDGTKMVIADYQNHRVLIYNHIPIQNNASADFVIGQVDMTHNSSNQGGSIDANTISGPIGVYSNGEKLFVSEILNNRILIFNHIPTQNNASADYVIGQVDFNHGSANQGGASPAANTLRFPFHISAAGEKLIVGDANNHRVLIYNHFPNQNNASADVVIGQEGFTQGLANKGGTPTADSFSFCTGVFSDGTRLMVGDNSNYRALIFNTIPTSNGASADVVIGQANFTGNIGNQGTWPGGNTIWGANNVIGVTHPNGSKMIFISDFLNGRVPAYLAGPKDESLSLSTTATASPSITLSLSASEAKDMMISEEPDFEGASWEEYATAKDWTLSSGDGTKTVYAKFRDFANFEGSTKSRQINFDSTAPTISDNLSGSILPPGTASKELTLATTENSTCKYSTNQNDSYTQMTTFSSTGEKNHSTTFSNLADGTSYAYYIKCQDALLNTKDYQISFSLASPAYAPIIAIGQHKVYNLSPKETVALKVSSLFFKGKLNSLKYGKVEIYENGKLKKTERIRNSRRWRMKIRQADADRLCQYQFKYFNSHNEEVLTSNTYNILIDRVRPVFTDLPKKLIKQPGEAIHWQTQDNDQMKYYQYTFRGKKVKTNDPQFILPQNIPKGTSRLTVRAYDRAENKSVRRVRVRVR
jgi:hypothetical protein